MGETEMQYSKMATLKLSNGMVARFDDRDLAIVARYNWYACKQGNIWYALSTCTPPKRMHRLILNLRAASTRVDHRNGDGLDNRRSNLRKASHAQNAWNGSVHRDNRSGFKGVTYHVAKGVVNPRPWRKPWRAIIEKLGKRYRIGKFATPEAAAAAYDAMARKLFGEFAKTNFN